MAKSSATKRVGAAQWTVPLIEKLSEKSLRQELVIPLLREMGFEDVRDHDGGALEQGKDVLMFRADPLCGRLWYGLVLKRGPVAGRVSPGSRNAGTIDRQIRQCLNARLPETLVGGGSAPHRCVVITSGVISKEAHASLAAALGDLSRSVVFVDGPRLIDLLNQYMPRGKARMNWQEVNRGTRELLPAIASWDPDLIVGTGIGGFIWGGMLAGNLRDKPFIGLDRLVSRVDGQRKVTLMATAALAQHRDLVSGKKVLIVSAELVSGQTTWLAREALRALQPREMKIACLDARRKVTDPYGCEPDFCWRWTDNIIQKPWRIEDSYIQPDELTRPGPAPLGSR